MAGEDSARSEATGELDAATLADMGKREFLEQLQGLAKTFAADSGNPGSYQCVGCTRCANCIFCRECEGCYHCTHCIRCQGCNNCTHCVDCQSCHGCAYCHRSQNCTGSAYVVLSQNLSECNYCFGCIGLAKKDFHILNRAFSRTEYFRLVSRLRRELGVG